MLYKVITIKPTSIYMLIAYGMNDPIWTARLLTGGGVIRSRLCPIQMQILLTSHRWLFWDDYKCVSLTKWISVGLWSQPADPEVSDWFVTRAVTVVFDQCTNTFYNSYINNFTISHNCSNNQPQSAISFNKLAKTLANNKYLMLY